MNCLNNKEQMNDNLVWDQIIYYNDPGDIRKKYHLDYIFSEEQVYDESVLQNKRICVIAHMYYLDLMEHCFEYIKRIPREIDIIITTNEAEKVAKLELLADGLQRDNLKIVMAKNRGREISALLVACKDELPKYEYLCFVHDKKKNCGTRFQTVSQSFMDILWENSIKNENYIKNVIAKFEEKPRLGFLTPPAPYMSTFFSACASSWSCDYNITEKLKKRLNLNCIMNKSQHPFALGTTFWCRTDALIPLFKSGLRYEDFEPEPMGVEHTISHGIERIFPYVAQCQGYYSGVMMTKEYASIYIANYQYMTGKIINKYIKRLGKENFDDIHLKDNIPLETDRIFEKCNDYNNIYIYGAGAEAGRCVALLEENKKTIAGYIVSNGHKNQQYFRGRPIYELDEIEPQDDELIIVALNTKNRAEVMPQLIKRGFNHIERYR